MTLSHRERASQGKGYPHCRRSGNLGGRPDNILVFYHAVRCFRLRSVFSLSPAAGDNIRVFVYSRKKRFLGKVQVETKTGIEHVIFER